MTATRSLLSPVVHPRSVAGAAFWYAVGTLATTWPLALGLSRDIPWDLGDSLLNCWILAWNAQHLLAVLGGDWSALSTLWHGNIFHPAPYALAYSELLLTQSVLILPVYAATENVILCYNLLFLSSFVLSGVGMYLLVRDVVGDWRAAFVAGMLYAFAMYRVGQGPHLQSLSSQWLPFAYWCVRRLLATGHWRWVAWTALAVVAHNLSNGYYLLFGALFLPIYVIYELVDRGLWRSPRAWGQMTTCAGLVGLATLPGLTPYLALRALGAPARPEAEVVSYSADVASYLTASPNARLWGPLLQVHPRPEGELFVGLTLAVLAGLAVAAPLAALWRSLRGPGRRRVGARVLMALALLAMFRATVVFTGVRQLRVGPLALSVRGDVWLFLGIAAACVLGAAVLSDSVRNAIRGRPGRLAPFALAAAAFAAWASLGPQVRILGVSMPNLAIYDWLYDYVPGFDGLRVPARLAMFVTFFLALAAGDGAQWLLNRTRASMAVTLLLALAAWSESVAAPMPLNASSAGPLFKAPPARVNPTSNPPALYRFVRALPASTVLVELPFGDPSWEARHVYYAAVHRQRLVNGYSGGFPRSYLRLVGPLSRVPDVDGAWEALAEAGATHVVVHDLAFEAGRGSRIRDWLTEGGARLVGDFGTSGVYELKTR